MNIAWGKFATAGIFLAKAILGVQQLSTPAAPTPAAPAPAATGQSKREVVTSLFQTFLEAVAGNEAVGLLGDPEVLDAFNSANDAIVHFQNVLARKHADTTSGGAQSQPPQP